MRVVQQKGTRGSLKWIQRAIACRPDLIQPSVLPTIRWVSPLATDDFAEYRDDDFLGVLGLSHLRPSLRKFWPRLGPQWDALGVTESGVILTEAKAHVGEFRSPPSKAGAKSLNKIMAAFALTQKMLGCPVSKEWTGTYYQYTNRFAHLAWLVEEGIDAHLLFVSFLNDRDMRGPSSVGEWQMAFRDANKVLEIPIDHELAERVHHVCPDVAELRTDKLGEAPI